MKPSSAISHGCNSLCVVLILALPFLYVRQNSHNDLILYRSLQWSIAFGSSHGAVRFAWKSGSWGFDFGWHHKTSPLSGADVPFSYANGGFDTLGLTRLTDGFRLTVPVWLLILMLAIKPISSFLAWRRSRELSPYGHQICTSCGYDLHGIEGNNCPECGEGFSLGDH